MNIRNPTRPDPFVLAISPELAKRIPHPIPQKYPKPSLTPRTSSSSIHQKKGKKKGLNQIHKS